MEKFDLTKISSELIRSVLRETVQNQLKSNNFNIELTSASCDGENNYVGVLYRLTFWKEDSVEFGNGNSSTRKMILKIAPEDLVRRNRFYARPAFLREIYMYENVLQSFRKFELSKGVTEESGFFEYPKCYKTIDIDRHECLLLEDLNQRAFTMLDKNTEEVTADHVNLVMRSMAKLHAISFAFKDQQSKRFAEITSQLRDIVFNEGSLMNQILQRRFERIFGVLSDETDGHLLSRVQKVFSKPAFEIAADCIDPTAAEPATIVTHGDIWQNNIMFRYDNDGKPIEASLLDWQLSRYSSPVIDIVFFIFNCTTKELRDAHYEEFLRIYHQTLSTHIQRLGSDPIKLFSYELMIQHLRKFGKYALIMAIVTLRIITSGSDIRVNLNRIAKQGEEIKRSSKESPSKKAENHYETRLRDIVIDMARLDYI